MGHGLGSVDPFGAGGLSMDQKMGSGCHCQRSSESYFPSRFRSRRVNVTPIPGGEPWSGLPSGWSLLQTRETGSTVGRRGIPTSPAQLTRLPNAKG